MFLFDLHCDTLTTVNEKNRGLLNDGFAVSLDRLPGQMWCQCFAIYMPDRLRGAAALNYFEQNARFFRAQMNLHANKAVSVRTTAQIVSAMEAGKVAAMLTVEGGSALAGSLENVRKLASAGVKILTLTWNGKNELGSGSDTPEGISFFGRMAVAVLEQQDIVLDVSHLNERGFWDISKYARRPFIATHSDSRAVHDHPRNLTDDQFKRIVEIGGVVGLNFFPLFVNGKKDASFEDLAKHVEHFLALGGEDSLCLGSDFDGAQMPSWLRGTQDMPAFYERMCKTFGNECADKIFGANAMNFFRRYEALAMLKAALGE